MGSGQWAVGSGHVAYTRGPDCLTKNGYNETKCAGLVDALYDCCRAFYEKHGDGATSVSCPKADLLRLKIAQRKEAG